MTQPAQVKPCERDTIVQALAADVVPRIGLQHIQVGRATKVGALIKDTGTSRGWSDASHRREYQVAG